MVNVIGHRGAAGLEPENTLRSIRKAIELGVDQVEIDVRLTKDCQLVVIHDATVDRTTNGRGYVKDFTFDELRLLDAGKGEQIPSLEEVLNLTKGKIVLQIELKEEGTARPVVRLIESRHAEGDVIISSFIHGLLEEVHRLNPRLETGTLFYEFEGDMCQRAVDVHSKAIHVYYHDTDAKLVAEARGKGLKVVVWGVPDTTEAMKRLIELDVDGICTDRPDILINLLKSNL